MDLWITDSFSFLATAPVFRAQLQGTEALSAWTLAKLDTILEDPYGGWSAVSTGSQAAFSWLCPPGCSGWYEVTMTAEAGAQAGTSNVWTAIYLDGTPYQVGSASLGDTFNTSGSSGGVPVPLVGGADYVQMYIFSTSNVNTPATAGRYPTCEIAWLST
jgi:hypothetical protein